MTRADIETGLRDLGLGEGDHVFLHSSLSSLGYVEGGADAVVDALLAVLGDSGTLAVPTFGDLGIITEVVRNRPNAVASIHPRASIAAIGGGAGALCRDHWKAEMAHGEDTPYTRLADMGGYVCLLGVDQDRNTTLHTVESLLRLAYLNRTGEHTFSTPEGEVTKSWPFFPGPHRDFIGLDRLMQERGAMKIGRIGSSVVRLIKSRSLIDCLLEAGRRDPAFALCDNLNCADCVRQRAGLRRDRFAREDFQIAVAGSLAGRYIPEMVENCQAAGVDAVELDAIQGMPVHTLEANRLVSAVEELRDNGCEVSGLRLYAISEDLNSIFQTAAECRVKRVLLPLTPEASSQAEAAEALDLRVVFYNAHLSSRQAFALLDGMGQQGLEARFAFQAAHFVRAGEKPFLTSLGNRLKRFTVQLDVEDLTFDGTPAVLAGGNAEIKEMISILRCSGFSGYMVLGSGNRSVGSLGDAAGRFIELLDAM